MTKALLTIIALAFTVTSFAQAPEGFNYQAVIRDASSNILTSQPVGMQLMIRQGSAGGTPVYTETFSTTTNGYGLVNLEIGTGTTTDDFTIIDWANGPYFMETSVDVTGGVAYMVMGTNQLMSVPYALHAKTADNVINDAVDDADNDPTNEIDTWGTLSGIPADFSDDTDDVDDADADPNNEIQTISRTGTTVTLSNGGGTFEDSVGVYTAGEGVDITNNVVTAVHSVFQGNEGPPELLFWFTGMSLEFPTETLVDLGYNNLGSYVQVESSGKYLINYNATFETSGGALESSLDLSILINGVQIPSSIVSQTSINGVKVTLESMLIVELILNDTIEVWAENTLDSCCNSIEITKNNLRIIKL